MVHHCPLGLKLWVDSSNVSLTKTPSYQPKQASLLAQKLTTSMSARSLHCEREMASNNQIIGELELKHLPLAASGGRRIVVNFDLDVNGVLSVWAEGNDSFFQRVKKTITGVFQEYRRAVVKDALLHGKWDVPRAMISSLKAYAKMMISRAENVLLYKKEHDQAEFEFSEPLVERILKAGRALAELKAVVDSRSADVLKL